MQCGDRFVITKPEGHNHLMKELRLFSSVTFSGCRASCYVFGIYDK